MVFEQTAYTLPNKITHTHTQTHTHICGVKMQTITAGKTIVILRQTAARHRVRHGVALHVYK